jgi:hypothetical protein
MDSTPFIKFVVYVVAFPLAGVLIAVAALIVRGFGGGQRVQGDVTFLSTKVSRLLGILHLALVKEVGFAPGYLYVSDGAHAIRVPFAEIEKCWSRQEISRGLPSYLVYVSFKTRTRFGRKIAFRPYKYDIPEPGGEHAVVSELKEVLRLETDPLEFH